jgi:hypothetical protein
MTSSAVSGSTETRGTFKTLWPNNKFGPTGAGTSAESPVDFHSGTA